MSLAPWEPPFAGTEVEHVLGSLERLQATFRWKADGLDAAGLGTRLPSSTLTVGGLLKHLALQEDYCSAVNCRTSRLRHCAILSRLCVSRNSLPAFRCFFSNPACSASARR